MDRHMSASLDRYITGNWGEDQFRGDDDFDEFVDRTCANCICQKWCPTFVIFCEGEPYEPCLVVKSIMEMREAQEAEYWKNREEEDARIEFELQHDYPIEEEMSDKEFQEMLDKDAQWSS